MRFLVESFRQRSRSRRQSGVVQMSDNVRGECVLADDHSGSVITGWRRQDGSGSLRQLGRIDAAKSARRHGHLLPDSLNEQVGDAEFVHELRSATPGVLITVS